MSKTPSLNENDLAILRGLIAARIIAEKNDFRRPAVIELMRVLVKLERARG